MKSIYNVEIGSRVKKSREAASLTQERMAETIGVSVQYISDMERGKVGASTATIVKICNTLNVSADYILMGRNETGDPTNIDVRLQNLSGIQRDTIERIVNLAIQLIDK